MLKFAKPHNWTEEQDKYLADHHVGVVGDYGARFESIVYFPWSRCVLLFFHF